MKLKSPLLFTLVTLIIPSAMAQEMIIGPSPASRGTLDLYEQPNAAQAARQIGISEAGLPLPIHSKQAGYLKVLIDGKEYWLRSTKVRVSRDTTANCGAVARASSEQTAATPGAGKDVCK